jgi:hypothetical protein
MTKNQFKAVANFLAFLGFFIAIIYTIILQHDNDEISLNLNSNRNLGLSDVGYYINAGQTILEGNNPYRTIPEYFSGPISGVFFKLTYSSLGSPGASSVFLILALTNVLGLYLFVKFTTKDFPEYKITGLVFLLMILSPGIRETIRLGQISGILMGLAAILVVAFKNPKKSIAKTAVIFTLGLLLLEMKPHIMGLFVLCLFVYYKSFILLIKFIIFVATCVFCTYLVAGSFIHYDWLTKLLGFDSQGLGFGMSRFLYPIVLSFGVGTNLLLALSLFSTVTMSLLALRLSYRQNELWIFMSFLPCILIPYPAQQYSALPLLCSATSLILVYPRSLPLGATISSIVALTLQSSFLTFTLAIAVGGFCAFLIVLINNGKVFTFNLFLFSLGYILVIIVSKTLMYLFSHLHYSIISFTLTLSIVSVMVFLNYFYVKSDSLKSLLGRRSIE